MSETNSRYDVVTIGETMLRLTPPGLLRWEQAASLDIDVGGSESNTAVGLARLGHRVAWLSRLPEHPLGRLVASTIAGQGVDTSHVCWAEGARLGLYFYEQASPPRPAQVIYDRAGSAFSEMSIHDLAGERFVPGYARWLHVTGISLAVSNSAAEMIRTAVSLAKQAGWKVSFDVNYRSRLWTATAAKTHCEDLMTKCDLVFCALRDAQLLLGHPVGDANESTISKLQSRFPQSTLVLTLGRQGAIAANGNQVDRKAIEPIEPRERLGGGDAFSAGFLSAMLDGHTLAGCLDWGAAAAALKYSMAGDLPLISRQEIESLIARPGSTDVRR